MLSMLTSASAANHPLVQSFRLLLSIEKKWLLGHFQGFFFFFEEFKVILAIAPFLVWPSFCFYVIANYVHISRACNFFFKYSQCSVGETESLETQRSRAVSAAQGDPSSKGAERILPCLSPCQLAWSSTLLSSVFLLSRDWQENDVLGPRLGKGQGCSTINHWSSHLGLRFVVLQLCSQE